MSLIYWRGYSKGLFDLFHSSIALRARERCAHGKSHPQKHVAAKSPHVPDSLRHSSGHLRPDRAGGAVCAPDPAGEGRQSWFTNSISVVPSGGSLFGGGQDRFFTLEGRRDQNVPGVKDAVAGIGVFVEDQRVLFWRSGPCHRPGPERRRGTAGAPQRGPGAQPSGGRQRARS